ncbi:MAG TPA: OmpA family protein [Prolixibacteraceae bacterium]|nr:OmpA family protein [Prolixibacteraceae bacterium]
MMKLRSIPALMILLWAIPLALSAQNIALSRADRLFELYAYSEAAEAYEKLLDRNISTSYVVQQLAYCYQKMGMNQKALQYYERHIQNNRFRNEDLYQYALLLLSDGRFEDARGQLNRYLEKVPRDRRALQQIDRIDNFSSLNLLHLTDSVTCLDFNSRFSDMSPAWYADTLAFVSARDSSGSTYSWNNQPFLDIYRFRKNEKEQTIIEKFPGINTRFHEGPLSFVNKDQTIWFTRNNQKFSKIGDNEQTNNLKIYRSDWDGNKWSKEKEFDHNSNDFSVGHPAFGKDGQILYFASNMPGGYGETDLYLSRKADSLDAKGYRIEYWTEPENLGNQLNTDGKEMFPFVDARGIIFFASDGLPGFGGLDIFAAFPVADSFNVINLGQPINSTYDDFSLIVDPAFTRGYFTSNRSGGVGSDDLYSFQIGWQHLNLKVLDAHSGKAISGANIDRIVDEMRTPVGITDAEGLCSGMVDPNRTCIFEVSHPQYRACRDSILSFAVFSTVDRQKVIYLSNVPQLTVSLVNKENGAPVPGATIKMNLPEGDQTILKSDEYGKAMLALRKNGNLGISVHKEGFVSREESFRVENFKEGAGITLQLDPIYEGKTFVINNLYYDVNSSLIRTDAARVLDEVYKILEENPSVKIELSSHTDSRGKQEYNQWLSQRRAQSAVDYLISKGISPGRLIAVGAGESKLLNHCSDGVECTDEEHQMNRRTEFKILEF